MVLIKIVITAIAYILNGIVFKLLWGWFMVPTLGLPMISMMQAIGIGIVISFLTNQYIPTRNNEEQINALIMMFIHPIFAGLVGFIVHLFM